MLRFPPSWTLFEPRCIDQQLPVTSYRQSLAGVLMYFRTFVYYLKFSRCLFSSTCLVTFKSMIELLNTPSWYVAISYHFGTMAEVKILMARKGRAKRVKRPRTKNKRFPIGDYKYAMKEVKGDYLLECRSLQMEKEKLNAVIVEVGVFRRIQCTYQCQAGRGAREEVRNWAGI